MNLRLKTQAELGVWIFCSWFFLQTSNASAQDAVYQPLLEESMEIVEPVIFEQKNLSVKTKKQALLYYAVDSADPFMQIAVDYEVRTLIKTCNPTTKANFVAILNSHYVNPSNRRLMICRSGVFTKEEFPRNLFLEKMLDAASDPNFVVTKEDMFDELMEGLKDVANEKEESPKEPPATMLIYHPVGLNGPPMFRALFKQYPLAYIGALRSIWAHVISKVFPTEEFTTHLHLKSHGSSSLALTGLTSELLEFKRQDQFAVWEKLNAKRRSQDKATIPMPQITYGTAGQTNVSDGYDKTLAEYGFGAVCSASCQERILRNQSANGLQLNSEYVSHHLNSSNSRLGLLGEHLWQTQLDRGITAAFFRPDTITNRINQLELTDKNYFGSSLKDIQALVNFGPMMELVLAAFHPPTYYTPPGKLTAGFIFLESCQSGSNTANVDFNDVFGPNENEAPSVMGYFAPVGSIWFRNIDWDIFFEKFKNQEVSDATSVKYVGSWAHAIPNFLSLPPPNFEIQNQCTEDIEIAYQRTLEFPRRSNHYETHKVTSSSGWWTIPAGYNGPVPFSTGSEWLNLTARSKIDKLTPLNFGAEASSEWDAVCTTDLAPYYRFSFPYTHDDKEFQKMCTASKGFMRNGNTFYNSDPKDRVIKVSACSLQVELCFDGPASNPSKIPKTISIAMLRKDETTQQKWLGKGWYLMNTDVEKKTCIRLPRAGFSTMLYVEGYDSSGKRLVWVDKNADQKVRSCVSRPGVFDRVHDGTVCDPNKKEEEAEFWRVPTVDSNGFYRFNMSSK